MYFQLQYEEVHFTVAKDERIARLDRVVVGGQRVQGSSLWLFDQRDGMNPSLLGSL